MIQMFGAYFYGYVDRDEVKPYLRVSHVADKLDKNDFMFSNSPYSLLYEIPPTRGPVVVQSESPPSPPMTLDSPLAAPISVRQGREDVGSHISTPLGLHGIDEFGTNTFQIHTWMAVATEVTACALLDHTSEHDEHSLEESAQKEEDIEMEQADEEDKRGFRDDGEERNQRREEEDTNRRLADVAEE